MRWISQNVTTARFSSQLYLTMQISKNRVIPESPETAVPSQPASSGRRYGGVDLQERQRQRRARLVASGLAVFGDKGYHAATVRDVCKAAELTSRYFYESFDGMEALFEAVYVHVSQMLMARILAVLQTTPPDAEKLAEASLHTFLEFIRDDRHRARVLLIDAMTVGPGIHRVSNQSNSDFAALISSVIEQLIPEVGESGLSPHLLSNGLVGANVRLATLWVEEGCNLPLDEVLHNMLALFKASLRYIRSPAEGPQRR